MPSKKRPVVLCILDGWGIGDGGEYDAIASASTPNWDRISANYPSSTLKTYGADVGLPEGQMGNSEVGHMNIGAGRVVMQYLPRVDEAFKDGSIAANEKLQSYIATLKESGKACHLMGLVSDGGVHAHLSHIMQMTTILSQNGVLVKIHAFTDGRDTSPQSGRAFIQTLQDHCATLDNATIATVSGRYYAMDRDNRWDRVEKAFAAMAHAKGQTAAFASEAVEVSYNADITDEFILPTIIGDYTGIADGDAILFANFRSDRAREILQAFLYEDFPHFDRGRYAPSRKALGLVEYSDDLNKKVVTLFPPLTIKNNLGEVLENAGLTQKRMAETEKYPHVTFFFNSGNETPSAHEDRTMAPSPKVATYDLQPEMSAPELTRELIAAISSSNYDAIIVNYANPDMVGHTGCIKAARKAVEAVDEALGQIEPLILETGGALILTADHGNADQMWDDALNEPHTAHTLNPVPFIVVGAGGGQLKDGRLADIAPTMLQLLGVNQPDEMTGESLIVVTK